jgi:putative transposase
MVIGSFCVGQRLSISNQMHRISRDLGNGLLAMEDIATGRVVERQIADLLNEWQRGNVIIGDRMAPIDESALSRAIDRAHLDAFQQSYSDEQRDHARTKLVYVTRLEAFPRTDEVMTLIINEVWSDKKLWKNAPALKKAPHYTTVARWIRSYENAGRDIRALVERHADKGNTSARVHPLIQTMVDDLIQTRFLTRERPTLKAMLKDLKGMVALANATRLPSERLNVPTYNFLKTRVKELNPYDVCCARYGKPYADLKFRVAGRGVTAERALARACMDHTRMDVFVVDERTGLPLGRPWLTIIIDEYTRYVLGYYLSFEDPSSVSMTRALRHAIGVKTTSSDIKSPWDAWGVMETLVVDNGMEFHARALEAGAGCYGITVQFCPRRKPWFKGKVERFFGTMNTGLLTNIKGKTFSNIYLKGDYDPAKHAVLTLETLRKVTRIWIADVYHQEKHSVLGCPPAQAWQEAVATIDRYLPPSSIAVDSAFSQSSMRRLTHKGIEFDVLFYNCPELGVMRERYGSEIDVEIRTHDDDLGSIVVVAPDGKTLLRVPALDADYAYGLTRWQHEVCKRFKRRVWEDDAREISLLDARDRIRALIQQDMQLTFRKSRKKQQRFVQSSSETHASPLSAREASNEVEPAKEEHVSAASSIPEVASDVCKAAMEVDAPDDIVPDFARRTSARGRLA